MAVRLGLVRNSSEAHCSSTCLYWVSIRGLDRRVTQCLHLAPPCAHLTASVALLFLGSFPETPQVSQPPDRIVTFSSLSHKQTSWSRAYPVPSPALPSTRLLPLPLHVNETLSGLPLSWKGRDFYY